MWRWRESNPRVESFTKKTDKMSPTMISYNFGHFPLIRRRTYLAFLSFITSSENEGNKWRMLKRKLKQVLY